MLFEFARYVVATLQPNTEVLGSIGVTRGFRGGNARPHRAVLCTAIIDNSPDLHTPQLMRANCYRFYEESPYDMPFIDFLKRLNTGQDYIGCEADELTIDCIRRVGKYALPIKNYDFTKVILGHPKALKDATARATWLPTMKNAAGASIHHMIDGVTFV